jgi:hypothetical protein
MRDGLFDGYKLAVAWSGSPTASSICMSVGRATQLLTFCVGLARNDTAFTFAILIKIGYVCNGKFLIRK